MKQKTVHQNLISKREMAEFNQTVDDIKSGKIKYNAIEADEFRRVNKIGEYREWEFDHKRIEQIQNKVKDGEAHMHPTYTEKYTKKQTGRGRSFGSTGRKNITKQQLKREREQLINEIENG